MIQINLLPDVKLEYIKARRLKRTITSLSVIVSAVALAVFVLLFISVTVAQKGHLGRLEEDIQNHTKELEDMPNLAGILTVQNQLGALTTLHQDKPTASRIFTYIQQLAPTEASIDTWTVSFDEQTMTIEGHAVSLTAVNKFADTLKFTKFAVTTPDGTSDSIAAFSEVVLAELGVEESAEEGKPTSYTITLKYAPEIFSNANDVKLTVPNQITTRSATEKPNNVFDAPTSEEGGTE